MKIRPNEQTGKGCYDILKDKGDDEDANGEELVVDDGELDTKERNVKPTDEQKDCNAETMTFEEIENVLNQVVAHETEKKVSLEKSDAESTSDGSLSENSQSFEGELKDDKEIEAKEYDVEKHMHCLEDMIAELEEENEIKDNKYEELKTRHENEAIQSRNSIEGLKDEKEKMKIELASIIDTERLKVENELRKKEKDIASYEDKVEKLEEKLKNLEKKCIEYEQEKKVSNEEFNRIENEDKKSYE